MAQDKLILRKLTSPFTGDITKSSVLSHSELDGNQIYLKGLDIETGTTIGLNAVLTRFNGDEIVIDLEVLSGITISGAVLYSSAIPMPVDVGGWEAGSTFSFQTMTEMWDGLLYPYQLPAFTSFARTNLSSEFEIGDSVSISSQTFTWAISNGVNVDDLIAGSIKIEELQPVVTILDSSANDGTEAIVLTTGASFDTIGTRNLYRVSAIDTEANTITSILSRTWKVAWYYGKFSGTSITDAQMTGLTTDLVTSVVDDFVAIPTSSGGEYIYLCVPDTLGQPSDLRDSVAGCFGTNHPFTTLSDKTINNQFGVSVTYKIYRFVNATSGAVNVWLCS